MTVSNVRYMKPDHSSHLNWYRQGIHPTAVVEGRVGEGTKVGPFTYIGPEVTVGDNCEIGPSCTIGWDGFGYANRGGVWQRKPQTRGVKIADDVHIGASVCIDRGSYRDTRIGCGTKVDNLVHVAHNVWVGQDCLVIAQAELSGSVEVGDGAWIGPSACVREHLKVGAGATVGLGAVVVKDIPAGETWCGNPAKALPPPAPPLPPPRRPE